VFLPSAVLEVRRVGDGLHPGEPGVEVTTLGRDHDGLDASSFEGLPLRSRLVGRDELGVLRLDADPVVTVTFPESPVDPPTQIGTSWAGLGRTRMSWNES
jgi:hypothetical protein